MMVRRTIGAGVLALCAGWASPSAAQEGAQDLAPFLPPPCVAGQEMFTDVPASSPFCRWIEQLVRDHITAGCGPQLYCPGGAVTREQMAVFLELAMRGTDTWIVDADLLDGMDSGDFVSAVDAGTGLSGGGSGGSVAVSLADSYRLPQTCAGGQHVEWTGTAWGCGSPGTGTVTSVASGPGLTGGPITTSGTISVAPGGITGSMIASGAVGSAQVADGAIASADVADGTIGAADVASAQVQLRVAPPCAPGQFIRAVNADGTVVCAADADSGGTVTSVATGGGLTGGPITGAGTISVATGGITGAMIADGAVASADIADGSIGAADVNSTQVQRRVSQGCGTSGFMRAVNPDGTVSCGVDAGHTHFGQDWQGNASWGLLVFNFQGIGVYGGSGSTSGTGVRGQVDATTGSTAGVVGAVASTSGTGVIGSASAVTGDTMGVSGSSHSPTGMGVRGWALSSSGEAVGVYGKSESTSGIGVRGEATFLVGGTNPSYGVEGLNHRDQGAGVRGQGPTLGVEGAATANFGIVSGVHGTSSSTQGRGVQGTATATSGQPHGVYGSATSPSGIGVGGYATATTGLNFGVFGSTSSASGYAGYFSGRVQMSSSLNVLGNLSVGGIKNFKIDHPLDPAHKYLVHASVESSEMLNIYSGTVVLDAQGAATVQLPEWFEALNRDFRYQLTCVGGYAPVYISAKVRQGRFGIAGGMPGLEVSWQVTGVRSDAHALAHPMAVEEEKPREERGTYLDPEAHGQPAALARDYKVTGSLPRE